MATASFAPVHAAAGGRVFEDDIGPRKLPLEEIATGNTENLPPQQQQQKNSRQQTTKTTTPALASSDEPLLVPVAQHGNSASSGGSDAGAFELNVNAFNAAMRQWDAFEGKFAGPQQQASSQQRAAGTLGDARSDLQLQKDMFSKLKYQYLERQAKKGFLQTVQQTESSGSFSAEWDAVIGESAVEMTERRMKQHKQEHAALVRETAQLQKEMAAVAEDVVGAYAQMLLQRERVRETALLVVPAQEDGDEQQQQQNRDSNGSSKRSARDSARADAVVDARARKHAWHREMVATIGHLGGLQVAGATESGVLIRHAAGGFDVEIDFTGAENRPAAFRVTASPGAGGGTNGAADIVEDVPYHDIAEYAIETRSVSFFLREFAARAAGWAERTAAISQLADIWPQTRTTAGSTRVIVGGLDCAESVQLCVPFDYPARQGSRAFVQGVTGPVTEDAEAVVEAVAASMVGPAGQSLVDMMRRTTSQL